MFVIYMSWNSSASKATGYRMNERRSIPDKGIIHVLLLSKYSTLAHFMRFYLVT
jgi:hypothetical protein